MSRLAELELTRTAADRRVLALGRVGTLRLKGRASRAASAEAGGRRWEIARRGLWRRTMEATDATGTTAGRFAAHGLRRGGSLQWGDRELALRPATRRRERYTLVDGDHVLAVLEGSCWGRRLAGRAGDLGADGRAAAGRAQDVDGSAERVDAVGETPESGATRRVGAADAVVGDLDDEAVVSRVTVTVAALAPAYLATLVRLSETR